MRTAALLLLGAAVAASAEPPPNALDPELEHILAVLEAREKATGAFRAEYFETGSGTAGRRMGPRFFAWSPQRSLYRGPKVGKPYGIQSWFARGKLVERESLYYKDEQQNFWLSRETVPVGLFWNGTRGSSRGPDYRDETGLTWAGGTYSAFLRRNTVRVLGRETLWGDACVKLLAQGTPNTSGFASPTLLWLSEASGYFPRKAIRFHSAAMNGVEWEGVRLGAWTYYRTHVYHWEQLGRKGAIRYPLRIRIESVAVGSWLIEVIDGTVRFGDEVTPEDFALPGLYFLRDNLEDEHAAVTPLGRVRLTEGMAGTSILLCLLLALLVRRRWRKAAIA
ncbi:MAG: hypothetical protein O7C98_09730 [Planctomycetota bacterium]|nr:hypothetical protein [Planctomycetota bacterium]